MSEVVTPQARPTPVLYPEKPVPRAGKLDRLLRRMASVVVEMRSRSELSTLKQILPFCTAEEEGLRALSEDGLKARAAELAQNLRRLGEPGLAETAAIFAVIREASRRILGLRHHDVQVLGGYALMRGTIAEMFTGEGKTLTATLAAIAVAVSGHPVHVVTVNDYLAKRDAQKLKPLYDYFGLSVGVVYEGMSSPERRAQYACDITYCTNKELAFDYLKDRLKLSGAGGNLRRKLKFSGNSGEPLIMRGLYFAIVDEVDSVLIDEARTPLILSGESESRIETTIIRKAMAIARTLKRTAHFRVITEERRVELLPEGLALLDRQSESLGGIWQQPVVREELVHKALNALHCLIEGQDYIIQDGKIAIVDEYTGRTMADRFWSDGLHQMVELKEGLELSAKRVTLARMTYQRFFRRYMRLAGMSGTVREVRRELWQVYGLRVIPIPPHKPRQHRVIPDLVFSSGDFRWNAVASVVARLQQKGVPVLVGTRSVRASEEASRVLTAHGIAHDVLNAKRVEAEAEIIAEAGQAGRVTVVTNMAGRGTDIELGEGVAERGGLHVVMCERSDAGRIDRQLAGRAARQGQPGVFFSLLSLDDQLMQECPIPLLREAAALSVRFRLNRISALCCRAAQWSAELRHARTRRGLLESEQGLDDALAFAGTPE